MTTVFTSRRDADHHTTSAMGPWVMDEKKPPSRLRARTRRRSIPHLLLGALLVLASAALFLMMSVNSGRRQPVLALAQPMSVGQTLSAQDLKQVNVAVDPDVSVVEAKQAGSLVGRTMSGSLPAGALLTFDAVSGTTVPTAGQALAALPLKTGQFPPEISAGTHVSVVFVSAQAGTAPASPPSPDAITVWTAVVTSVTSPPNQATTVVSVQLSQPAARQVAAVPAGQLSIVMLPGGDQ